MGLFGELDAHDVSDNPFYVAPDVYQSVLTDLDIRTSKDGEKKGLSFQWTIEEEDSEFYQNNVSEWINLYLTAEAEDAAEPIQVKRDRARLKARLTQCGVTADEMNKFVDEDGDVNPEVKERLIGLVAYVEVVETTDKNDPEKKYTNIKFVKPLVED